jgi:hypothetical protein
VKTQSGFSRSRVQSATAVATGPHFIDAEESLEDPFTMVTRDSDARVTNDEPAMFERDPCPATIFVPADSRSSANKVEVSSVSAIASAPPHG